MVHHYILGVYKKNLEIRVAFEKYRKFNTDIRSYKVDVSILL